MVELYWRTFVMLDQELDEIVRLSALVLDALHVVGCRPDTPVVVSIHESNDGGHDTTDRQHSSGECADGQNEPLRSSLALEEPLPRDRSRWSSLPSPARSTPTLLHEVDSSEAAAASAPGARCSGSRWTAPVDDAPGPAKVRSD